MKTRRRRFYKGGDAIEGEQGCVIIPSLLVDAAMRTRNTSYVTKIFFKDSDFEEEKSHNDMIMRKVDPKGTFTSVKYTTTPIDLRRITPQELSSCSQLKGKDITKLKFLNYKYLGKSIDEIVKTDMKIDSKTSQAIIAAIANLSVKLMYLNNDLKLFHNDIHEGNIMFNFKEDYAYLIDFGRLSEQPISGNALTDFQGLVTAARLFATSVAGQKKLPPRQLELLESFIKDSSLSLNRTADEAPEASRELIVKFLTDFSLKYTTSVGGKRRRKTLRRRAH